MSSQCSPFRHTEWTESTEGTGAPASPPVASGGAPLSPRDGGAGPTIARLRHRAEVPMLVLGGVLTAATVIIVVALALTDTPVPDWASVAVAGLGIPVFAWAVLIRWQYWSKIANGVEVTPDQLPDLWAVYSGLAREMGFGATDGKAPARMRTIPPFYMLNGNGTLNAYAAKCRTQTGYVVVYSDLVEMAYRHGDFSGVRFVLAHELGHIKCGHVSLWRMIVAPVMSLPRLAPSLTRAQEYTADRTASYYAPEGAASMMILYAGKNMYTEVDRDAYFASVARHRDGFWLKAANFMSDHAVGFRRMEALHEAEQHGWDVHGKNALGSIRPGGMGDLALRDAGQRPVQQGGRGDRDQRPEQDRGVLAGAQQVHPGARGRRRDGNTELGRRRQRHRQGLPGQRHETVRQ